MTVSPPRQRVARERLGWLRRVPLSNLLLRQEYVIAVGRTDDLLGLPGRTWASLVTRELVTVAVAEYVADPFLLRRDGLYHLYFEVLNLETGRGELSVAHSRDLTRWTYGGVILREPWHLSYPYVFEHDGEVYLIPESAERGAVTLYRAAEFPRLWEKVADLLTDAPYVDSSIFRDGLDGGHWWLVTSLEGGGAPLVYRAAALTGPWDAVDVHGQPDADRLRSAGRIFLRAGAWHRPVQRRGQVYGEDVWLMRIDLRDGTYRETLATDVPQPLLAPHGEGWNSLGMHHMDVQAADGGFLAAVDGKALILDLNLRRTWLRIRNKLLGIGRS
ncbi:hypothetical protein [Deinococcus sp.]|uniref:glucosamine inositolphosphorylceramide transferase family protein n=1 Tax=Deinococcus sp. TaxID=47478 RepID=UPI002869DD57|nr:hypothetical protein [Deinococcus sp.]